MLGRFSALPRVLVVGAAVSLHARQQTLCEQGNAAWPFDAKVSIIFISVYSNMVMSLSL
jgi:hypothetical protein